MNASTTLRRFAVILLAGGLLSPVASARIEAPDHVLYGNVSRYGDPVPNGTIILLKRPDGTLLVQYELGRDTRLGSQYALHIPMDAVDPRRAGFARPGDPIEVFVGADKVATTEVGAEGVARRLDLDPQNLGTGPAVRIADTAAFEGNTGTTTFVFDITLSTTSADPISIDWATEADTAAMSTACAGGADFIGTNGTLVIAAGGLAGSVSVEVCGDTTIESDESFRVRLLDARTAVIADDLGIGLIRDDDNLPRLAIRDARVVEPTNGTTMAQFEVSLDRASAVPVSVGYSTANLSALAGFDYTATTGTLTIAADAVSGVIEVPIRADAIVEMDETFALNLSNPNGILLTRNAALGTIIDPAYQPTIRHDGSINGTQLAALQQPSAIAVSPDGADAYVTTRGTDAVLHFRRSGAGALTHVATFTTGSAGFASAKLDGAQHIVASADGLHLYVAARSDNAVTVLGRNPDGSLTFIESHVDGQAGVDGLAGASALALAPDGGHLYVAGSDESAIAVFGRGGAGALTFREVEKNNIDDVSDGGSTVVGLDRPSDVVVSPDGQQVYVSSRFGNAVVRFTRDAAAASGTYGRLSFANAQRDGLLGVSGLSGASGLVVAPDGQQLYAVAGTDDSIVRFDRGAAGALSWIGVQRSGDAGLPGLDGASALTMAPNAKELFVTGYVDSSLTVFRRVTAVEPGFAIGQLVPRETIFDGEAGVNDLGGPVDVLASDDGSTVYVVSEVDNAVIWFRRNAFDDLFGDGFE